MLYKKSDCNPTTAKCATIEYDLHMKTRRKNHLLVKRSTRRDVRNIIWYELYAYY